MTEYNRMLGECGTNFFERCTSKCLNVIKCIKADDYTDKQLKIDYWLLIYMVLYINVQQMLNHVLKMI